MVEKKLDQTMRKVAKLDKQLRSMHAEIDALKSKKADAKKRLFRHNTRKLKTNMVSCLTRPQK